MKHITIQKITQFDSKKSNNLLMLFSMTLILIGLFLAFTSKDFTGEIVTGLGVLTSGYGFMKLSNK